ncbi:TPA: hypothetical protein ACOEBE_000858 [Stenotrophomonas maltophilia]|uniref:hypothetical protein n=1 Tax=Stenotrophomonas maltophilia TaxID=40324 RepID=UPI000C15D48C|nr:hypothetical protein [Stenotrophomonas maltophilia]MCU1209951.1 hypothetical protein [Stenotrophomonas maltophilia]HEL5614000.1 hypothetical protein [Stenotrophomonas maltophilia]
MSTLFNALKDFAFENAVPLLTGLFLLIAAFAAAVLVYPPAVPVLLKVMAIAAVGFVTIGVVVQSSFR